MITIKIKTNVMANVVLSLLQLAIKKYQINLIKTTIISLITTYNTYI